MEFYPRRLLQPAKFNSFTCFMQQPPQPPFSPLLPPPQPPLPALPHPPPPLPPPSHHHQKTLGLHTLSLLVSIVVAALFFGFAYAFIANCCFKRMAERRRLRRRNLNPPIFIQAQEEDFLDEEHGPPDHPIWYINTIGLQQSVIDSIAVFKYKREDGLIEGTECSICLSEFSEDECLRLLPKCSHAFHLPCIDAWLRSHKNCPVCRAPVVKESQGGVGDDHAVEDSNVDDTVSQENRSIEAIREGSGTSSNLVGNPSDDGAIRENLKKVLNDQNSASCGFVGKESLDKRVAMEGEMQMQPIRRSVSMNGLTWGEIYRGGFNVQCRGRIMKQRIMDDAVQMKNSNGSSDGGNRNGGSSSVHRSTRSYSFGPSLQKGPVSMKRSSSSGKIWSTAQWRIQNLQNSL